MRKNLARNIVIAAALSLAATASAQAAEFMCFAKIGPASAPNNSSQMFGSVQAGSKAAAEAQYQARVATIAAPVRSGRWVIHSVECRPNK